MAYENIRADTPGFCAAGDYFYIMKPAPTNMLIQKTSYGDPVMTYPFSHEINLSSAGTSFLSLQYDGINFWSLEKRNVSGNLEKERILRRWRIESFMCVLKDSWRLRAQGISENINGKAFAIENYYNILSEACGPGTSNLDRIKLTHPHSSFFHVTDQFHLRSATQGYEEDVPVATILNNYTVTTAQPIQRVYYPGDPVNLRRDLYFFNNASPSLGDASAAVYWYAIPHITAADPTALNELTYKGCHDSGMYEQTQAATFITASGLDGINQGYYTGLIAYVRGQQLLLKRPNMPGGGFNYPGPNADGVITTGFDYVGSNIEFRENMASMIMDNAIKNDRVTLWSIYDLASSVHPTECKTVNIYRLQTGYTYGAIEGSFSSGPYNYVVSVMKPMVTSIALTAEPALVVANGVDKALIYATVRDQYGAALNYKRVVFGLSATDTQTKGYFLCPEDISECVEGSFTWLDGTPHAQAEIITGSQSSYPGGPPARKGQAVIEWRAGTKAGLITVLAIVQP
jgi:hypothetical protein